LYCEEILIVSQTARDTFEGVKMIYSSAARRLALKAKLDKLTT